MWLSFEQEHSTRNIVVAGVQKALKALTQFQRWLKEWSEKRNIPVAEAPTGRRDDFIEPYFKRGSPPIPSCSFLKRARQGAS